MAEPHAVRDVVERVTRTVGRRGMLEGGETVVVAVSGGPDSLALLHALLRLGRLRLALHVAHFDHRLRPGSERDASFVRRHAERLGLGVTAEAADEPPRARGRSPEEAAREARLAFLERVLKDTGAARIATGHTADDQAETVLMRLILGAGSRGLAGIPPVREPYIRPLIDVRRSETVAFCRALRLRPRRDPTNDDTSLLRNAIRGELMPLIESRFNRRASEALGRAADIFRDEDLLLDALARRAAGEPLAPHDEARFPLEAFRELPPALQRRVIRLLVPADARTTERIRALALEGATGDEVDISPPLKARLEYGFLLLGRSPSPVAPPSPGTLEAPGETVLPSWGLRATVWVESSAPATWPDGRTVCVVDADRIAAPLTVRRVRAGDRFRPLGMTRSKKVGDFFTDAKVPRAERARVPLVADANGVTVWLAGYRIDDRVKVTPATRRFLWIHIRPTEEEPA